MYTEWLRSLQLTWQWFEVRSADCPLWPVTDVFLLQIQWAGTQSRFVRLEVIHLFSVAFCEVRAVHKFGFKLVINETRNKWRPAERSGSDRDMLLTGSVHWAGTQSRFVRVEVIHLFSVAFCEVRAVHKFGFRLVIKTKHVTNDDQQKGQAVTETHVFDRICMSSPPRPVVGVNGLYPSRAYQLHSLE
jgi:hypothetical protein